MSTDPATPTPSLQRRVTVIVVALLTVLLTVLGLTIDVVVGVQARRNLHDRLLAATSRADALTAAHTAPDLLATELNGGSVRALLVTADGATYGDRRISPDTTAGPGALPLPPGPPLGPPGGPPGGPPLPPPGFGPAAPQFGFPPPAPPGPMAGPGMGPMWPGPHGPRPPLPGGPPPGSPGVTPPPPPAQSPASPTPPAGGQR